MGNIEKLAVLIVLLLSAVVLAFSLNDDGDEGQVDDPFRTSEVAAADGIDGSGALDDGSTISPGVTRGPGGGDGQRSTGRPESAPIPLLDAEIENRGQASQRSKPETKRPQGLLTTRQGLRRSFVDEYMEYTVEKGDTWSGLALRFYSDARMVSSLRIANDDLTELRPGTEILVPVHDLSVEASKRERFTPVERPATHRRNTPSTAQLGATQDSRGVRPTSYTVVSGDSLSTISKKVFGTTTRWAEIFAANRGVLESPDWLSVGMELVIPADGEFAGAKPPAPVEATDPKPTTEPATKVR